MWIALIPDAYKGVAVIQEAGEAPREVTGVTKSFIEMNGLWGVFTLLIPVFITLAGFQVSLRVSHHTTYRNVTMWVLFAILLLLCAAGVLSIGAFYLPAAIALLAAAILNQVSRVAAR